MSSLFNDGDSCCGQKSGNARCKGSVCKLLNQLANNNVGSLCSLGTPQQVFIIPKGESTPLDLLGATVPTVFTLVRFDPETCTAVFSYLDTNAAGETVTRTYVTDCRSIAGIVCLNNA